MPREHYSRQHYCIGLTAVHHNKFSRWWCIHPLLIDSDSLAQRVLRIHPKVVYVFINVHIHKCSAQSCVDLPAVADSLSHLSHQQFSCIRWCTVNTDISRQHYHWIRNFPIGRIQLPQLHQHFGRLAIHVQVRLPCCLQRVILLSSYVSSFKIMCDWVCFLYCRDFAGFIREHRTGYTNHHRHVRRCWSQSYVPQWFVLRLSTVNLSTRDNLPALFEHVALWFVASFDYICLHGLCIVIQDIMWLFMRYPLHNKD